MCFGYLFICMILYRVLSCLEFAHYRFVFYIISMWQTCLLLRENVNKIIEFFFFRTAGTVGAIVTCPLEVVKTRLQSSTSGFYLLPPSPPASASSSKLSSLSSSVTSSKISENSSRFTPYHQHHQQYYHYHHLHHSHPPKKSQQQQHYHRHHRSWSNNVALGSPPQQKIKRLSTTNGSRYSR